MKIKVTILGCGGSGGVPIIGNDWGACNPQQSKNRRRRASILIQYKETNILIDTSPDLREQLLSANVQKLDAVFYTHDHGDHVHGIDDLRGVNLLMKQAIPVYADASTLEGITRRFDYIFDQTPHAFYKPALTPHILSHNQPIIIKDICIKNFVQDHGLGKTSLGYRVGDFAYSTDIHSMHSETYAALNGITHWVVDCVRYEPHPSHSHFSQTLEWIDRVKPNQAWLTHMNQHLDYDALLALCPRNVEPAYDGLEIELPYDGI